MKKLWNLIVMLIISLQADSQTYLPVEENQLLLGGLPTNNAVSSYNRADINRAYRYLLDTLKFEYRYIYGACESRAHFISLALRKKGIESQKIWAFAPLRYTLLSRKQFVIPDPLQITDNVVWSYHVAPVVVTNDPSHDTLVIDPSFDNIAPIPYRRWLQLLKCPEAVYNFTNMDYFLFNSLDGLTVFNNVDNTLSPPNQPMPKWFPNVVTGDFFSYNVPSNTIPIGLAGNDLAMEIYAKERNPLPPADFTLILGNVNNLLAFLQNQTNKVITTEFLNKYRQKQTEYGAKFQNRKTFWINKTNELLR